MPDFYELDFLPVDRSDSGDAISVRYRIGDWWSVHVIDGGYERTAPIFARHIRTNYGTNLINRVIITHPDQDHAEGLAAILQEFEVLELWMLRPWLYAEQLLPYFARYQNANNLRARLREDYPYIAELERIAVRKGIKICEPFQGQQIGPFTVLAPSPRRYGELILESERTPQRSVRSRNLMAEALVRATRIVNYAREGWGSERFSSETTSVENEMSVIQYAELCGHRILLTGDAGRDAMAEAAEFAPFAGLELPGIDSFQVPHHGGRRNLSTELCDHWLGQRLGELLPENQELFTAMISAAREDAEHPRKAVLRAMMHRGARIATTETGQFQVQRNAPKREGWVPIKQPPYPHEQEA